jgi:hypothetical protein
MKAFLQNFPYTRGEIFFELSPSPPFTPLRFSEQPDAVVNVPLFDVVRVKPLFCH